MNDCRLASQPRQGAARGHPKNAEGEQDAGLTARDILEHIATTIHSEDINPDLLADKSAAELKKTYSTTVRRAYKAISAEQLETAASPVAKNSQSSSGSQVPGKRRGGYGS